MNAPRKHDGPEWEPEWIKDMREIEKRIAKHVDHYIRARRSMVVWIMCSSMAGYWVGWGVVELLAWYAGIKISPH